MRALVIAVVIGCSAPSRPLPQPVPSDAAITSVRPTLRLPDGVTPLAYDLRLEVDPQTVTFRGAVAIRVRVDRPTREIWLHADELEIEAVTWWRDVAHPLDELAKLPRTSQPADSELVRVDLQRTFGPGELTLGLTYTGHTEHDEEGLFRQRDRGDWYLFSQAESVFARRFVPCFDEPRWKTPWRVTVVVPGDLVALGNAAVASDTRLADGRRAIAFAETPPMPSYLLAVAAGPFKLIDAGVVGRERIPLRVAVAAADAAHAKVTGALAGKLVAGLEAYVGEPLPWPKLDFVAVPKFFGAMENPGLVTFQRGILVGDADARPFADHFVRIAAHELAHQWLGNWVTPAWWDDLWLAEAFATWLGDKMTAELGALDDPALRLATAREAALAADDDPDARPLRRALVKSADAESEFDAISYEKGAAVLAMFESWLGAERFRTAVRAYLHEHAGGIATSADLIAAVAAVGGAPAGDALRSYVDRAGAPVVELASSCTDAPHLDVTTTALVPVCVRTSDGRTCAVIGEHGTLPLAHCPAWVIGNAGGEGYYHVAWRGDAPRGPATPREQLAHGDDVVAALARDAGASNDAKRDGSAKARGALIDAALDELSRLANGDPYAQLAATAIAEAIDALVPDATRPAWSAWLAKRFAGRLTFAALTQPGKPIDLAVGEALLDLAPIPAAVATRARAVVDKELARDDDPGGVLLAIATHDRALFERLAKLAERGNDTAIEALGSFGPEFAPQLVELAARSSVVLPALRHDFARGETRIAAWRATRDQIAELSARLTNSELRDLIDATGSLCDARDEVAATLAPVAGNIADGRRVLDHALALIDRCSVRRAAAGDIGGGLRR